MALIPRLSEYVDPALMQQLWNTVRQPPGVREMRAYVPESPRFIAVNSIPAKDNPHKRDEVDIEILIYTGELPRVAQIANDSITLNGRALFGSYTTIDTLNDALARGLVPSTNPRQPAPPMVMEAREPFRHDGLLMLWQWLLYRGGSNWYLAKGRREDGSGDSWEPIELHSIIKGVEPVVFFSQHIMQNGAPFGDITRPDPERLREFDAVVPLSRPLWHEEIVAGGGVMSLTDIVARQLVMRPTLIPPDFNIGDFDLPDKLTKRLVQPVTLRDPITSTRCVACSRADASWTSTGTVRVCNQQCSDRHWNQTMIQ